MQITLAQFRALFPALKTAQAESYLAAFADSLNRFQINTDLRLAAYSAQLGHESVDLTRWIENLNYTTAARIRETWKSRFPTVASAQLFVRQPQKLAEKVYGGRRELGNVQAGDGWRFRGRGPIQATGREMYAWLSGQLSLNLTADPDLLLQPSAGFAAAAAIYAIRKNCNTLADSGLETDFKAQTKRINGGYKGWEDRKKRWLRNQQILGIQLVKG
jgi:putative chitinase